MRRALRLRAAPMPPRYSPSATLHGRLSRLAALRMAASFTSASCWGVGGAPSAGGAGACEAFRRGGGGSSGVARVRWVQWQASTVQRERMVPHAARRAGPTGWQTAMPSLFQRIAPPHLLCQHDWAPLDLLAQQGRHPHLLHSPELALLVVTANLLQDCGLQRGPASWGRGHGWPNGVQAVSRGRSPRHRGVSNGRARAVVVRANAYGV